MMIMIMMCAQEGTNDQNQEGGFDDNDAQDNNDAQEGGFEPQIDGVILPPRQPAPLDPRQNEATLILFKIGHCHKMFSLAIFQIENNSSNS